MRTLNAKITGTNFGVQEDGSMVFYLTMEQPDGFTKWAAFPWIPTTR